MPQYIQSGLFVLVLATFLGLEVIRRVPPLFHTPFMSLTNSIAAISLVESVALAGSDPGTLPTVLGAIAVGASTLNVVGGFILTNRMLRRFKGPARHTSAVKPRATTSSRSATWQQPRCPSWG